MMQIPLFIALLLICNFAEGSSNETLRSIFVNVATKEGELRTEIHFTEKDILVARRAEEIIKTDLTKAVEYFQYIPKDTIHFNIDPYLRLTNGNATVFPTNIINLYNFPANNLEHLISLEDWLQGLIFHEFIHVIHLDQTRDFLEVGRNIFGTIAKIPPGVVPRWFTEGIAVWGESHFLAKGRLQNDLLNKDLWILLKNEKSCSTIDCLDTPLGYPHGQLAYWAGGHFMNYLENKKAGTIKCLVFENSKRIPFFLNGPFEECAGAPAQELFHEFREEYLKSFNESVLLKENGENIFGVDDSQKGTVKVGDLLLKVESQKKKSALVRYDLKEKVATYHIYNEPIAHLGEIVKIDNETNGVLVAFFDDPQFTTHNKTWKVINTDTLLPETTFSISHDPNYVIPLSLNNYLIFTYEENHWRAYKINNDGETLLREWPLEYNLVSVTKNIDQLVLKINTANLGTKIYTTDVNLEKLPIFPAISQKTNEDVHRYPDLEHLKPHYWFLTTGTSSNPSSIGITTSLADPMNIHSLLTSILLYPSISKMGGQAEYTYTDHYWKKYSFLSRDFSTNTWSSNINSADDIMVGTSYLFELKKWIYKPFFNIGFSSTNDAISSQNNKYWTLANSVFYQALSNNDFWQIFLFSLEFGSSSPSNGTDYLRLQNQIKASANINDEFSLQFKMAYGKLYKDSFDRGVLYGGGIEQMQLQRRYEFYGIPYYGDAYGNEILTARLTGDYNFLDVYRGKNFIPFFLKEVHGLFGIESLAADIIYIDHHFYRNESLSDWFVGTKLMTNLFYFVPANINLIYSNTTTPRGNHVSLYNVFLNLDF